MGHKITYKKVGITVYKNRKDGRRDSGVIYETDRKCIQCEKPILVTPKDWKRMHTKKFCSNACKYTQMRVNNLIKHKNYRINNDETLRR